MTADSSKPHNRHASDHIDALLTVAHRHLGEPQDSYTLELDTITDLDEALDLYARATDQVKAARVVKAAVGERLAQLLGVGGAACYGTQIVRYKLGSSEKLIDADKFTNYVTRQIITGPVRLDAVFNPNNAKVGWMNRTERDTFYTTTDDDEPTLTDMPIDRAPKFLQTMRDGDIRIKEDTT